MSAATDAALAVDPLSTGPTGPSVAQALQQEQQEPAVVQEQQEQDQEQQPVEEEQQPAPETGRKPRKTSNKEAPKKIYFCAKPGCPHSFDSSVSRRPCYVQNGSFSKGTHKKTCGGGYRWLELRDVEREPHVQLEQTGQQFFIHITGPHGLAPRQGRAGHSPHMRGEGVLVAPHPDVEPGNVVITADDSHAAYTDTTSEAALAQAALTAGQHHVGHVPTGPPADVQAAMAGVSSDVQAVIGQLWREVAELQKLQAELNHRTSAAEQAAQLLVGAAQRERQASAAAAADSKQIREELAALRQAVAHLTGVDPTPGAAAVDSTLQQGQHQQEQQTERQQPQHGDRGAQLGVGNDAAAAAVAAAGLPQIQQEAAEVDASGGAAALDLSEPHHHQHHDAAAAAAVENPMAHDGGGGEGEDVDVDVDGGADAAHAPIPGLEAVDIEAEPHGEPSAVGKTGRADDELPPAKRLRATVGAK